MKKFLHFLNDITFGFMQVNTEFLTDTLVLFEHDSYSTALSGLRAEGGSPAQD